MAIVLKSTDSQNQLAQIVIDRWREMKQERNELEEVWKRCFMAYLGKFDKAWVAYARQAKRSHRFVELSFDSVATVAPQITDAVFGPDEWLKLKPLRLGYDETDDDWSDVMQHYLKFQMMRTGYRSTVKLGIKQLMMLGNCPWGVDWTEERAVNYDNYEEEMALFVEASQKYHAEREEVMADYNKTVIDSRLAGGEPPPPPQFKPAPTPVRDLDLIYAGPKLWIGSIFDYLQEQHPNTEDKALRIYRSWRTKAYLKRMAKQDEEGYSLYSNINKITDMESEERAADNEAEVLMKMALGMEMPHGKDKVDIKEMHGDFEVTKGGDAGSYRNYIVTIANEQLIRCEPSKFFSGNIMIQNARINVIKGAVYGQGIVEKGLSEQDSANAIHNQTIDATNSIIQPELAVNINKLVDGVLKPSGPGVRHETTQDGAITPILKNYQGIPFGHQALAASIARHERFTGAVNTAPSDDESATKTARNTGVIATKLGSHVEDIEETFISPSVNMFIEMDAQYADEEEVFEVTQNDQVAEIFKLPPHIIRRGWVAHAAGSKYMAEKDKRIQDLMMALQLAKQDEANGQPTPVRIATLTRRLYKEILGDADDVVMSEEAFTKERFAHMQVMMAQAQIGGQQNGNGQAGNNKTEGQIGTGAGSS